jgi:hypothetical protein
VLQIHTMLPLPLPHRSNATASRPSRLEVCPPALQRTRRDWWPLWLVALKRALARRVPRPGQLRLEAARADFLEAVGDLQGDAIVVLRARIRFAASMRELWHLRGDLFDRLCTGLTQSIATERLARLNRHFPTRAPRSGFAPLLGGPR